MMKPCCVLTQPRKEQLNLDAHPRLPGLALAHELGNSSLAEEGTVLPWQERGGWSRRASPQGSMPSLGLAEPSKFRQPESSEMKAKRSGPTPAPPPLILHDPSELSIFLFLSLHLHTEWKGFSPLTWEKFEMYDKASVFSSVKE